MKRQIRIEGDVAYVPLTKGYEVIIDAADVPLVAGYNWSAMVKFRGDGTLKCVYGVRAASVDGRQITTYLHRVLLDAPDGLQADHIDGDGLNNRRVNLRLATPAQNKYNTQRPCNNTSGVKGVDWRKHRGKWQARIKHEGGRRHLGLFDTLEEAAAAYAAGSAEYHGEFGRIA